MIKANINPVREVVGLFADRVSFEAAVAGLIEAGFPRTDLSVLGSHESLDAAGEPAKQWKDAFIALVGELKFEVPLVASGAIVLAGGPTAALIGGLIAAAVGGIAIKDIIGGVTAIPHTEDFARAVEAGSVILWVRAANAAGEDTAGAVLRANGGTNVHVHEHSPAAGHA